jgi:hypothetical protein
MKQSCLCMPARPESRGVASSMRPSRSCLCFLMAMSSLMLGCMSLQSQVEPHAVSFVRISRSILTLSLTGLWLWIFLDMPDQHSSSEVEEKVEAGYEELRKVMCYYTECQVRLRR